MAAPDQAQDHDPALRRRLRRGIGVLVLILVPVLWLAELIFSTMSRGGSSHGWTVLQEVGFVLVALAVPVTGVVLVRREPSRRALRLALGFLVVALLVAALAALLDPKTQIVNNLVG